MALRLWLENRWDAVAEPNWDTHELEIDKRSSGEGPRKKNNFRTMQIALRRTRHAQHFARLWVIAFITEGLE